MACEIVTTRGGVFVLWGRPAPEDMDQVLAAVEAAAADYGQPVVYVTRVPVNAPPPEAPARARLNQVMPQLVELCSSYHVVLEGEGFGAAMKRGILTGIFQLSWRRRTFFVHGDAREVMAVLPEAERPAARQLLLVAERRGLMGEPKRDLAPAVR